MGRGTSPLSNPPAVDQEVAAIDLRDNITAKKGDLRDIITKKSPPAPKKQAKPWLKADRSYSGPGLWPDNQDDHDIRERGKTAEAREKEKEAELALAATRAAREAAEEDEARAVNKKIALLVSYKDALVKTSCQPHGSQRTLHSRKRGRTRTPSRSRSSTPAPSASRSPRPAEDGRRLTARRGKDKSRRQSYSRSPSPEPRRRAARSPARTVPGLSLQEERRKSTFRGREYSPPRSPPRPPSPRTPPSRSPSWQVACRRRSGKR